MRVCVITAFLPWEPNLVPEIETQSFRVFDINSDDCDEDESEEDLSDGAFERMHQKHEQAEYKMVQKDKAAQQLQKRQRQEEKAKEKNRNPFPEHLYRWVDSTYCFSH